MKIVVRSFVVVLAVSILVMGLVTYSGVASPHLRPITIETGGLNNAHLNPMPEYDLAGFPSTPPWPHPSRCTTQVASQAHGVWVVPWQDDGLTKDAVPALARRFGRLDFAWLKLDKAGVVQRLEYTRSLRDVLDTTRESNPCTWRFVTLTDEGLDRSALASLFFDEATQRRALLNIAQTMASHPQAQCLTVDLGWSLPQDRKGLRELGLAGRDDEVINETMLAFSRLIGRLRQVLSHQKRCLSVIVPIRAYGQSDTDYILPTFFDVTQLATYADQVLIRATNYSYSTGNPGAIAPRDQVKRDFLFLVNLLRRHAIPPTRLAGVVPLYGYDWKIKEPGQVLAGTEAEQLSLTMLHERERRYQSSWRVLDRIGGESCFEYTDEHGQRHMIVEAATSLRANAANLLEAGAGAVMAWSSGNTDPDGLSELLAR